LFSGVYLLPCDELEKERLDILHRVLEEARRGNLLNAPFEERPPGHNGCRVLDLGFGTGFWLVDMAAKYRNTEFVGIDLANMGPDKILENVTLLYPRDYESPWALGEESWDIIHIQMACGSVSSWPNLYSKVMKHLRPGTGWFEQVEIDLTPRCDDGTLSPDSRLVEWYNYIAEATFNIGRPIAYKGDAETHRLLTAAGFKDIRHEAIRIPLNTWPTDPHEWEIGVWYYLSMTGKLNNDRGGHGVEAISLAPLYRTFNWPVEHVWRYIKEVERDFAEVKFHTYHMLHIWSGRAPFEHEKAKDARKDE
jgi:SAM-dependent methyltransferase